MPKDLTQTQQEAHQNEIFGAGRLTLRDFPFNKNTSSFVCKGEKQSDKLSGNENTCDDIFREALQDEVPNHDWCEKKKYIPFNTYHYIPKIEIKVNNQPEVVWQNEGTHPISSERVGQENSSAMNIVHCVFHEDYKLAALSENVQKHQEFHQEVTQNESSEMLSQNNLHPIKNDHYGHAVRNKLNHLKIFPDTLQKSKQSYQESVQEEKIRNEYHNKKIGHYISKLECTLNNLPADENERRDIFQEATEANISSTDRFLLDEVHDKIYEHDKFTEGNKLGDLSVSKLENFGKQVTCMQNENLRVNFIPVDVHHRYDHGLDIAQDDVIHPDILPRRKFLHSNDDHFICKEVFKSDVLPEITQHIPSAVNTFPNLKTKHCNFRTKTQFFSPKGAQQQEDPVEGISQDGVIGPDSLGFKRFNVTNGYPSKLNEANPLYSLHGNEDDYSHERITEFESNYSELMIREAMIADQCLSIKANQTNTSPENDYEQNHPDEEVAQDEFTNEGENKISKDISFSTDNSICKDGNQFCNWPEEVKNNSSPINNVAQDEIIRTVWNDLRKIIDANINHFLSTGIDQSQSTAKVDEKISKDFHLEVTDDAINTFESKGVIRNRRCSCSLHTCCLICAWLNIVQAMVGLLLGVSIILFDKPDGGATILKSQDRVCIKAFANALKGQQLTDLIIIFTGVTGIILSNILLLIGTYKKRSTFLKVYVICILALMPLITALMCRTAVITDYFTNIVGIALMIVSAKVAHSHSQELVSAISSITEGRNCSKVSETTKCHINDAFEP